MPKVSVLVAVYNAEPFLSKCLDSLVNQTLKDIQIICVDDASIDGSLALLRDYAARDSRIEVITLQANQGQAHARNVALQQAQGEYICMLDADDWFSPDALEQAVAAFDEDTDCVLFELVWVYDSQHEELYPMPQFDVLTGADAFKLSLNWQIHGLYMIRADIHCQHPYDETCRLYSDDNTTRLHYFASREVRECQGVYYYRQHSSSVSHAVDVHRFDYLEANASMRKMLLAMHSPKDVLDEYEICRWKVVVGMYMFYYKYRHELASKDRKTGLEKIKQAWKSIDPHTVRKHFGTKYGYCPLRFSWKLFRLQEEIYFSLRKLIGRL